ncbi:mannitol dehydrogenase family protein [Leuconostoc citreum]|uniref:mannitol dehydrogenase family protein n=1 Tax=Leuconostoc citreum TaxID=33964 RepID=UPI0011BBAC43|nr:mannitol dehydrogenase family protein [Leuconostoc citreum]QEA37559.1 mannitol dehydrogenase family protein [Leuconostoc citreum]
MVKLSDNYVQNRDAFELAGVKVPSYDHETVVTRGLQNPRWIHFGGGNLFRAFHAAIANDLIEQGELDSGLIVVDTFSKEVVENVYHRNNNQVLRVVTKSDGSLDKQVFGSISDAVFDSAEAQNPELVQAFENRSLQIVTFSITEKGYALTDSQGELISTVQSDLANGPENPVNNIARLVSLLWRRFNNGAYPLALLSTDNFSQNGDRLKAVVLRVARAWLANGFVNQKFVDYLSDANQVSFPLSMIDRITPNPSARVSKQLLADGISGMEMFKASYGAMLASFANTEETHYLVVEDAFPNGRPALEKAGVIVTDRDTVNDVDEMKVTTSLNPLHTALALYGSILGNKSISEEMKNPDLVGLIKQIGYVEGLPVVKDPKVINPKKFIDEVVEKRLPNPYIPDTPQRIATDTSQKLAVRYGVTIQHYLDSATLDVTKLKFIPLTIAVWFRYLLAVDDDGETFEPSPDPQLSYLQEQLEGISLGFNGDLAEIVNPILMNKTLFGVDLVEAGLSEKIVTYLQEMLAGKGAVAKTLHKKLAEV